jgi:hypothetical protein
MFKEPIRVSMVVKLMEKYKVDMMVVKISMSVMLGQRVLLMKLNILVGENQIKMENITIIDYIIVFYFSYLYY